MKNNGWVKIYRDLLDNPTVMKDSDHLAVWVWLLLHATSKKKAVFFGGEKIYLKPGELTTGRKIIARELLISQSKVQRILKSFENEHQIEQRTDYQCRLISIVNWDKYQQSEQRNEQRVNSEWTASEQRVNTKQEGKEGKNERNKGKPPTPSFEEVCDYVHSMNYEMDPEAFYDYYQDTNWTRKNGMHIKDWQAAVRSWERREKRYREEHGEREQEYKPIYHKPAQIDPLPEPTPMPDYMKKLFGGGN